MSGSAKLTPVATDLRERHKAELAEKRREGYEAGRKEGEKAAEARYADRLDAARVEHAQEIARLDERHKANDVEIRGAAYWRGKVIGAVGGLVIGCFLTVVTGALMFQQNERALQAGADVAQGGMTAGLAVDALREGAAQPEQPE
jgi:hypothetical protein